VSAVNWAAMAVAVTTVIGSFIGSVRWLVKHYLAELKPNGGGSMNDRMTRLESSVDTILRILER
jgi:hypothetical protein